MPEQISSSTLLPFFAPRGIGVIGASTDPTKLGYGLARNLVHSNYQGTVHFVNPRGGNLFGRTIYRNLLETPDPIDLVFILIPAGRILQVLNDCIERGLKAAVIGSGGFRETGAQGATLEEECLSLARQHGLRLIGPNSVGLLDTHLPLDATFLPPPGPLPGEVAFISHSGAICAAVIDWARGQSFGLSRLVSLGNQADVNETDVLAPIAADPHSRVLTLYLEGVSNGRRFVEEAGRITPQKPIIALKVGRYAGGRRAVASHTGALAGEERAYQAAFRRAGVIRAETSEEMFDWARALAWCPPPAGRAIAVLTNAGGPGAAASDALEGHRLRLAELSDETRARLGALLPPAASLLNPVDMLASASPELYAACLKLLLGDAGVDGVLVILPPPPMYTAGAVAKALIPVVHSASKPVVVALMGERLIQEAVEHLRAARVPEYRFPERAASAMAVLAERAEFLQQQSISPPDENFAVQIEDRQRVRDLLQSCPSGEFIPAEIADDLLRAYHIPTLPLDLARSPDEAVRIAEEVGFPVVLKIASPDIPHKSEVNGILLDLHDVTSVRQGYERLIDNARQARPQAMLTGVLIQPMLFTGQEVIVGAVQDAQFGPLVMFGLGGVEVEGLKDVGFSLAPLNRRQAERLLDSTWAGRRLDGYRSLLPADRQAVIDVVLRLAQLVADFPQLIEIEINPLRVFARGAVAVDIRARLG